MSTILDLAQQAVEIAKSQGVSEVEAYSSQVAELEVEVSDGQVENLQKAEETGLSLRILKNGRLGFAYTNDLSRQGLERAAQEAIEITQVVPEDRFYSFPDPIDYEPLDLLDREYSRVPVEEKIELAKEIEAAARAYDSRVRKVRMAQYSERFYEVAIANSHGLAIFYQGTGFFGSTMAVAEADGVSETGWGFDFAHRLKELDPKRIGEEAARRSVEMLGAKRVASQKADIVLDPVVGAEFLGVIAPALTGEAVQKGKSLFYDKVGQEVASKVVNIVDDGRQVQGAAAAPVDDEGVPTGRTQLVAEGKLQGFLHSIYTAGKAGVEPTGNGLRSSYRGRPESSPSNIYLVPGDKGGEQIISEVQKGLYVTSVMGMHTANPISGDFSLGASGLWIENGEIAYPVRGVAIAGNIVSFLKSVVEVGSDLRFTGSYGAPTVRVSGISISG